MLVKVFIKRTVKKDKVMDAFKLLRTIRTHAMSQDGYISGETMINPDHPNRIMVISTWGSVEDWKHWKKDEYRKTQNEALTLLLEEPAEYESYVYSKFYLRVSS